MKKQSLPLFVLFVVFGSLAVAQTPAPKPASPLKQELNPNTDPKNQQIPAPAPESAPPPKKTASKPANSGTPAAGRTSPQSPAKESVKQPASAGAKPAAKDKAAPVSSQPAADAEKPAAESPAASAKRKLIADGYTAYQKHADFGMIYKKAAIRKGEKSTYVYVDEDGIVTPIDKDAMVKAPEEEKRPLSKGKAAPAAAQMVSVNRWSSPVIQDFVTIPENISTADQLVAAGYITRTFQYQAFLTRPEGDNVAVVNRWEMGTCKEFILIAEHEISDAQMMQWGYKNKQFLFYAYKTKPASGNYVAISRWVNALSSGSPCRDFTLSIGEHEISDSDLKSLGYSNKTVQFYVPDPR